MAEQTDAELQHVIRGLEAENERLRMREAAAGPAVAGAAPTIAVPRRRRHGWGRTFLATALIVVGALLAPVAVAASWSKVVLTDTDRFVASYAPLADDPAIQQFITDETLVVINEQVDIPGLTSDVIDGITALGTGPRATDALNLLKGPAASGIQSLIERGVTRFVESEAFANVWASALRISHTQLVDAVQNDPDSAVTLGSDGTVGIQLGPIVEAVKTALVAQGIAIAAQIPSVNRSIVVAQSDAIPTVQLAYGLAVLAGDWLPWIAIAFLVLGVLVARRRSVAVIGAAVALAVAMALLAATLAIGGLVVVASVDPAVLPANVATILYDTVVTDMQATTVAVLVLAVLVAIVGWLSGPFLPARRLRSLARAGAARIRDAAEARGMTTGRTGEWLYRQRVLMRALVGAAAAAVVLFVRPVTIELTVWTLVIAGVVLAVLEIVQRPAGNEAVGADAPVPEDEIATVVLTEPPVVPHANSAR
jgi:hypothetical protein